MRHEQGDTGHRVGAPLRAVQSRLDNHERTARQLPWVQLSVLEQETRETVLKTPVSSATAGQDWNMDMNMNKAEGRMSARTEERAQVLQGNKVPSAEQSPFGGTKSLRRNKVPSAEQSPFGGTKSLRRNKVPSAEQSPFGGTKSLRRNKLGSGGEHHASEATAKPYQPTGILWFGDNLGILHKMGDETVDLIYLDPPFNSDRDYNILFKTKDDKDSASQIKAFGDTWTWGRESAMYYHRLLSSGGRVSEIIKGLKDAIGTNDMMAYLVSMTIRLVELHRVLKPTGSLYLHCDPTASHYIKIVLDGKRSPLRSDSVPDLSRLIIIRATFSAINARFNCTLSARSTDRVIFGSRLSLRDAFAPRFPADAACSKALWIMPSHVLAWRLQSTWKRLTGTP